MSDVVSAVVFLVVGYVVLVAVVSCFTRSAQSRGRAEREQDRKDGRR